MLVVVHDRNVEFCFQALFDFKALGGFDVFEVDASEGWSNRLDGSDEFLGVFLIDFNVEGIDAGIYFKKKALSFHHGFTAHRTDVAESEDCRAVGNDCHKVTLVRVAVGIMRVLLNFETRLCHAGRIGE